jgi:hypothetical protein
VGISTEWIVTMCGWLRAATASASVAVRQNTPAVAFFYSAVPRGPILVRRKFVRRDGGRRCHRRISSISARSFSRARARSFCDRAGRFAKGFLQNFQDGEIARAPRGSLAFNDIRQRRNPQGHAVDLDEV